MEKSTFDYTDLNIERLGTRGAPPVVILHGWGSSASVMKSMADDLASDYRVWNVDLPGHGFSPPPPIPLGVPEHAQLVGSMIAAECGEPVTLIGHSNGGRISMYMASDDQLRRHVRRMVLISPSGIPRRRTPRFYIRKYAAQALKAPFEILPGRLREFGLDWLRHSLVWRLLGSSDYRALEGVMRDTFVKTVNFYIEDRIHLIDVPVLLFHGVNDEAISREQMKILEDGIPNAGLVELPGAGHYGFLDEPDIVLAAIRHFLSHADEAVAESAT